MKVMRVLSCLSLLAVSASLALAERETGLLRLDIKFKSPQHEKQVTKKLGLRKAGVFYTVKSDRGQTTLKRIQTSPGVVKAVAVAPEPPTTPIGKPSIHRMKETLERYEEDYDLWYASQHGDDAKFVGERPGCDYYEAYLYFLQERATGDSVDFAAYNKAAAHRDQMRVGSVQRDAWQPEFVNNWQFVGPRNLSIPYRQYYGVGPMGGRINGIAYHPTQPSTFYVAGAQSGLWRTTDQGVTWTCLSDSWSRTLTSCVTVDPTNPNVIYVGTGDYDGGLGSGYGIQKSVDGGATWQTVGAAAFSGLSVKKIIISPANPNHLIAVTDNSPIKGSTDGGITWTNRTASSYNISGLTLGIPDGTGNRALMAATRSTTGMLISTDLGVTWTATTLQPESTTSRRDVAASKVDPNTFYVVSSSNNIFKTTNRGATWTSLTASFVPDTYNWSQDTYDMHIDTAPNGAQDSVYVGLIDVCQSRDSGATWRSFGLAYTSNSILHNDQHSIAVNPLNGDEVMLGGDGGIYRANNANQNSYTITPLNTELGGTTQFYDAAYHPTDKNRMIGGTQDNASPASTGNLLSWANPGAGDGCYCFISASDPNFQVNTWQYLGVTRTLDNWATDQTITPTLSGGDSSPFVSVIQEDPTNGNVFYAGTRYLHRYDRATGWAMNLGAVQLTSGTIRSIAVAPSDGNRIYTGGSDGTLCMSSNRGANWITMPSVPFAGQVIKDIAVHPTNANRLIVVLSSGSGTRIYECQNASAATPTWTARQGSGSNATPNIAHLSICIDPRRPNTDWYVGTDVGVFMTTDGGTTWANITAPLGLPNLRVDELTYVPGTASLYAATHGRGIWRIDTGSTALLNLSSANQVYAGNHVTFTVQLSNVAPTGGAIVHLTSEFPTVASVPATVNVPAGSNTATFVATVPWRSSGTTVTISAEMNGDTRSKILSVQPLVADINHDGVVDIADYTILALQFDKVLGDPGFDPNADLDHNGIIDIADYTILATQFDLGGDV